MCRQEYIACLNRHCDGITQIGRFIPCDHSHDCDVKCHQVLRVVPSAAYCECCRSENVGQRSNRLRTKGRNRAKEESKRYGGPQLEISQEAAFWTMRSGIGAAVGGGFLRRSGDPFYILGGSGEDSSSSSSEDCSPCAKLSIARKRRRVGPDRDAGDTILDPISECGRQRTNYPTAKNGQQAEVISDDDTILDPENGGTPIISSCPYVPHGRQRPNFPPRHGRQAEAISDDEPILDPAHEELRSIFPSALVTHGPRESSSGAVAEGTLVGPLVFKVLQTQHDIPRTPLPEPPFQVPSPTTSELDFVHSQCDVPGTASPQDFQSMSPSPTLAELVPSTSAELAAKQVRDAKTARNETRLDDSTTPSPLTRRREINDGSPLPPAAPEILIDPALLHINSHLSQNVDPMQNLRDADEFLQGICNQEGYEKYGLCQESNSSAKKRKRD